MPTLRAVRRGDPLRVPCGRWGDPQKQMKINTAKTIMTEKKKKRKGKVSPCAGGARLPGGQQQQHSAASLNQCVGQGMYCNFNEFYTNAYK